jgi:hypothetical protein
VSTIDVDDTSRCPVAAWCDTCAGTADLDVCTVETPVGVSCATLCGACVDSGRLPAFPSWSAAVRAVGEHCEHLSCDVDEMAAALEAER